MISPGNVLAKQFVKRCLLFWAGVCVLFMLSACGNVPAEPSSIPGRGNSNTLQNRLAGDSRESSAAVETKPEEAPNSVDAFEGENTMKSQTGDTVLTATLIDNTSTQALLELLSEGPLTIEMEDYGNMEKVGDIGASLPRNDEQITTKAGDLILYEGSSFVIYYAPNCWNLTRLGHIDNVNGNELKELLGDGTVTVTLSLG